MEPTNRKPCFERWKPSPTAPTDLLEKLINLLYEREMEEPAYFSPEDLAAIEEGKAQIARGEYVTLEELKKELGL